MRECHDGMSWGDEGTRRFSKPLALSRKVARGSNPPLARSGGCRSKQFSRLLVAVPVARRVLDTQRYCFEDPCEAYDEIMVSSGEVKGTNASQVRGCPVPTERRAGARVSPAGDPWAGAPREAASCARSEGSVSASPITSPIKSRLRKLSFASHHSQGRRVCVEGVEEAERGRSGDREKMR